LIHQLLLAEASLLCGELTVTAVHRELRSSAALAGSINPMSLSGARRQEEHQTNTKHPHACYCRFVASIHDDLPKSRSGRARCDIGRLSIGLKPFVVRTCQAVSDMMKLAS
jgi:hypothetical protein